MKILIKDLFSLTLLLLGFGQCYGAFSSRFGSFIEKNYDMATLTLLSRDDLGVNGSFGGGKLGNGERPKRCPIIFVHGWTSYAGEFFDNRAYFLANGYTDEELYATSMEFSDKKGEANPKDAMYCRHVKHIRLFIEVVHAYTKSKVDVIGCSMGEVVSRKAILGGNCVDTGESLGKPLTDLVHTYVGVVGPNHGALACFANPTLIPCNNVTGMACKSKYLNDINSVQKYEASENVFTVYSDTDKTVGYKSYCEPGVLTSPIAGQDKGIQLTNISHHDAIFSETGIKIQFQLTQPSLIIRKGKKLKKNSQSSKSDSSKSSSQKSDQSTD